MSTPVLVVGYLASIFIPLAFLPQTIKIIKTRETKGISIPAYTIYFIGIITFLTFAVFKTPKMDIPMIICQTINGLFAITILSLTIYNVVIMKKNKSSVSKIETLSKTFILPIALLICCGLLIGIGFALKNGTLKTYNDVMGYSGAILISVAFLPQTYKLFKTKNTKGLSLITTLVYHLGLTLFIIYASLSNPINYPLLLGNIFGWVVNFCLLFLICYNLYQNRDDNHKGNKNKQKVKNGAGNAAH
ncbi:SemiSWEET family sugar transporter [Spiroplasma platyhelix]|uniref:PQ loop repeat protein n=1 Tax=Spiroplasma platyhelix PALS-1 TaxID=1276218 RepID=A0A846U0N0_9MOLU|nr:PQ-loop domain-containing transporter [Spiroplasma platyhelix]MBE4704015.1 hypothetical protein [Spiroplasma platyhelix PALS-1]NKE38386.1 hypothetical protein [Spiroplasma platyhelix PALS-1]UJB29273.1 hypothetical protein SPLAT_v1c05090 [Spiroplasma platyhelix PALS-1]